MSPARATAINPWSASRCWASASAAAFPRGEGHRGAGLGRPRVRANPIPRLPPVTRAFLPVSANVSRTGRVMGHRVPAMRRWSDDDLRSATLRRQFPTRLDDPARPPRPALPTSWRRIAPIQSQVPRRPVRHHRRATARHHVRRISSSLFEGHRLVKASTLRGTVFTSGAGAVRLVTAHRPGGPGGVPGRADQGGPRGGTRPARPRSRQRRRSGGPGTTCWTTHAA